MVISLYSQRRFSRSIYIKGQDKIPTSGPVIFVANHSSAFMDPILLGTQIKQSLHFLARGEAFKSKWAAGILKLINMIPIYRPEVEPEKVHMNKMIFKKCYVHLALQKSIFKTSNNYRSRYCSNKWMRPTCTGRWVP
jgi:hypothetical protein